LLADLPDLYFALPNDPIWKDIPFDNPFAAGDYCLMDATYNGAHLCPFLRLKLGWLRPRLICRSGHYELRAIESAREVWVLLHPSRGTREYFIVENRFKDGSYDAALPDRGLGVWHVIEDPTLYGSFIPPRPPGPSSGVTTGSLGSQMGHDREERLGTAWHPDDPASLGYLSSVAVVVGRLRSRNRLRSAARRATAASQPALGRRHAERVRYPQYLGCRARDDGGSQRTLVRLQASAFSGLQLR
jgi:hypothetical protein